MGYRIKIKSLETLNYQLLGFQSILFPLHSSRWFTRNIVHDSINVCDFVDDADADFLQDFPWDAGKVSGHAID